jgi:hypothetical protein
MFNWFRREKPVPIEQTDAYRFGQRTGDSMAADLDAFVTRRFDPVSKNYLDVLRGCLETVFDDDKAPPLVLARIEYKIFLENVEEMRPKMLAEINSAMSEWIDVAEQTGIRPVLQQLIDHRIGNFTEQLTVEGLDLLLAYVERLKLADEQWRARNPQRAAEFPSET